MRKVMLVVAAALATVATLVPVPAYGQDPDANAAAEGFSSDNMSHLLNITYENNYPETNTLPYGTDVEFATLEVAGAAVSRLQGDNPNNPASLAAAVSQHAFDAADTVVLATFRDYADALAGAPLAASLEAPLLLTSPDALSDAAAAEITRLGAQEVVILGGDRAVSAFVEDALVAQGVTVRRIAGPNRFETAGLVYDELGGGEVLVAEGEHADSARGWPDALGAGALGATAGLPVLLVNAARLPDETAMRLRQDTTVTVVGGPVAVSDAVVAGLDAVAGSVERIAGETRYLTSIGLADEAIARGASPATLYLPTGNGFVGGLLSGAAAGATNGVMVLLDGFGLDGSPEVLPYLQGLEGLADVFVVGDPEAVSVEVEADVAEALGRSGFSGEFAVAGSEYNGMQIVDITEPEDAYLAGNYDCGTLQGDIQVFEQDGRTYATFTSENTTALIPESQCVQDAVAAGDVVFSDEDGDGAPDDESPAYGTYIADITDPFNPTYGGFIPVIEGSHNGTVHPSGDWFYNSDSALINDVTPQIQIYDIRDLDAIERVGVVDLPTRPGLGTSSHDITFNADGTRMYSAALSQTVIFDTTEPANPVMLSSFVDPAINVEHQADPIDVVDGEGNARTLLIVQDELAGAAGNGFCPGGGLHIYDVTGDNELSPQTHKVGTYFIPDFRPAGSGSGQGESITCTSHVFRMYPEQGIMTIAWYNAGVWVLDISGLADLATSPASQPIGTLGFFYFSNSDTWSFKTNAFEEDGSFYGYGNDINRGFDVYRFDAAVPVTRDADLQGTWVTDQREALRRAQIAAATRPQDAPGAWLPSCGLVP